jgi:hypothetical protein
VATRWTYGRCPDTPPTNLAGITGDEIATVLEELWGQRAATWNRNRAVVSAWLSWQKVSLSATGKACLVADPEHQRRLDLVVPRRLITQPSFSSTSASEF